MRFSPIKLLHGLLYTAPVILLTLAACGGGGGGGGSGGGGGGGTTAYTLSVNVTGVSGVGVVLRNGGDNLTATTPGTYSFAHQVVAGTSYNISVLSQPSSPTQLCKITGPIGTMPASPATVAVSCVNAYTIGGTSGGGGITGLNNNGLVLQNNGADNYLAASGVTSFTFSTPVAASGVYAVTVLANPPGLQCTPSNNNGTNVSGNINNVSISCAAGPTSPPADPHVYAVNNGTTGSNGVSAYTSANGVLNVPTAVTTGSAPYWIAVDPGSKFAYVANYSSNTVSAYSIGGSGALAPLASPTIATGNGPRSIAIHPSGKFAYVANYLGNSVSAYSIAADGTLASIDTDGSTTAYEPSIPTRSGPNSIAIDPAGAYAYVANAISGDISVYSINSSTGALTAIPANGTAGTPTYISTGGTTPWSIKVSPDDLYLYVTNRNSSTVSVFHITSGTLSTLSTPSVIDGGATTPVSIAINPTSTLAYVVNNGGGGSVNVYTISGGSLQYLASSHISTGSLPISISIDSTGQYAYVANSGSPTGTNGISAYSINTTSGLLTSLGSSSSGNYPNAVITAK